MTCNTDHAGQLSSQWHGRCYKYILLVEHRTILKYAYSNVRRHLLQKWYLNNRLCTLRIKKVLYIISAIANFVWPWFFLAFFVTNFSFLILWVVILLTAHWVGWEKKTKAKGNIYFYVILFNDSKIVARITTSMHKKFCLKKFTLLKKPCIKLICLHCSMSSCHHSLSSIFWIYSSQINGLQLYLYIFLNSVWPINAPSAMTDVDMRFFSEMRLVCESTLRVEVFLTIRWRRLQSSLR